MGLSVGSIQAPISSTSAGLIPTWPPSQISSSLSSTKATSTTNPTGSTQAPPAGLPPSVHIKNSSPPGSAIRVTEADVVEAGVAKSE